MLPRPLLFWALLVWIALSSLECSAAVSRSRYLSQDDARGSAHSHVPTDSLQDASSEPGKSDGKKDLPGMPHVIGTAETYTSNNVPRQGPRVLENPTKLSDIAEVPKKQLKIDVKSEPEFDSPSLTPEFTEDGTEEEDESGVIRGKYSYLEEDGVPATIEYEAIPGMKFEIKNYIKGSKILPVPKITESEESGRALADENKSSADKPNDSEKGMNDAKNVNVNNLETKLTMMTENEPQYEHASVLSKNIFRKITRNTRSIDDEDDQNLNSASEVEDEITENDDPNVDNGKHNIDASYRFGFSADGQTRNEESDAKGNVQGSYSYIGEDGMLTKVEYEAGSGKGFVIKRIVQEDTKRSSKDATYLEDNFDKLNSKIVSHSPISSVQHVKSEDHQIQTPHKDKVVSDIVVVSEQGGEEKKLPKTNFNDDGSYSFAYTTPDQWREHSVDSKGHIKDRFAFIAHGGSKINKQTYKAPASSELSSQGLINMPKTLEAITIPNLKTNNFKIGNDGDYTFSYVTPQQVRAEAVHVKKDDMIIPENKEILQEDTQKPGRNENTADMYNVSPIKKDGSYSYSYKTPDQMRQEEADVDGNVNGQYSYVSGNGIRRTVHYKANPQSGFTAEGSHLPSNENVGGQYVGSNTFATKASPLTDTSYSNKEEEPTVTTGTALENPLDDSASPVNGVIANNQKSTMRYSNDNVNYWGLNSFPNAEFSSQSYPNLAPQTGFIRQQLPMDSPQVFFKLLGEKTATKDNENTNKHNKINLKRPFESMKPNSVNMFDGSYSFAYDDKDQLRRESVDTKGNMYSSYQYKTNDDGKTVVVFIRKRIKEGGNENARTARNTHSKKDEKNIPFRYLNENRDNQHDEYLERRNWLKLKRNIPELAKPKNKTPADQRSQLVQANPRDSAVISSKKTDVEDYEVKKTLYVPILPENANHYRKTKSIVVPFRGHVKYQRQII